MTEWNKDVVSTLIVQYRGRSKKLRFNATITILIIGALLITGITIFIMAGEIAKKENTDAEIKAYFDRTSKPYWKHKLRLLQILFWKKLNWVKLQTRPFPI